MQLISYDGSAGIKRLFSIGPLAMIGIVCAPSMIDGSLWRNPLVSLFPLIILGGFWLYFLRRAGVYRLADAVYDCDDHLKIRRGQIEEIIPFSIISGVSASTSMPRRISLQFVHTMQLGDRIEFLPEYLPKSGGWSDAKIAWVASSLNSRAGRARGG